MTEIISVRFKNGGKEYYFNPNGLTVEAGQAVIIETSKGVEFAECVLGNRMIDEEELISPLRPVLRIATEQDHRQMEENRRREERAFRVCQEKIAAHGLEMKLIDVEYNFDGSKILFFFTADGRVDFRALVKDLASVFRTRIELRQIGVRDEAKMLGGLGICGRPFCCSTFLNDFHPVSIKMAKTQNLSLNPGKISGACGRLMCCLKYEQEAYTDLLKRAPKQESLVETPDGVGVVNQVNLLRETSRVTLDSDPDTPRCYRNCDLCVVRNGKGKRPPGYEKPEAPAPAARRRETPHLENVILSQEPAEAEPAPPSGEGGSRRGGKKRPPRAAGQTQGQKAQAAQSAPERAAESPAGEGANDAGSAAPRRHRPHYRKHRPHGGAKRPAEGGGRQEN